MQNRQRLLESGGCLGETAVLGCCVVEQKQVWEGEGTRKEKDIHVVREGHADDDRRERRCSRASEEGVSRG